MARRRFIVQEAPIRHRDLARAAVDRKPPPRTIREAVRLGVARVGIGPTHRPDHRPIRRILRYRVGGESQVCRGLIDVRQIDREGLIVGQPVRIRGPHRDRMTRRTLVVQQRPIAHGDFTGIRIDNKSAARGIKERIRVRVTRIGISGTGRPHHRPIRRVLCHRIAAQADTGWRLIDIGQVDCEGLVVGKPARVRHAHRDAVARRRLIVQEAPIRHRDLTGAAIDRKPPPRTIREAIRLGIAAVWIRTSHGPHYRPVRRILSYGVRRETKVRWGIVDRRDGD